MTIIILREDYRWSMIAQATEARNGFKKYDNEEVDLDDLTFSIKRGEFVITRGRAG